MRVVDNKKKLIDADESPNSLTHQRARHVGDGKRNAERVHAAKPLDGLVLDRRRKRVHAPHRGAHQDAAPARVQPGVQGGGKGEAGVLDGLLAGDDGVLERREGVIKYSS